VFEEFVYIADLIINDPEVDVCPKFSKISNGEIKLEETKVTDVGTLCNYLF
jgi:hypothetical protein